MLLSRLPLYVVPGRCAPHLRALFSSSPSAARAESNTPSYPLQPDSFPDLQSAWRSVRALPEVESAKISGSAMLAGAELSRARVILSESKAGSGCVAVASRLEAVNLHRRGLLEGELAARTRVVDALKEENDGLSGERGVLLASSTASLAVASLRGSDSQRSHASVYAQEAKAAATCTYTRLVAELCCAATLPETESDAARARLSAIAALSGAPTNAGLVDVGGLARAMSAMRASKSSDAVEDLRGLVVRWDAGRPKSYDYIEALVAYGRALCTKALECDKTRRGQLESDAEDVFSKALAVGDAIGNELDKAEPLLAVAQLYARQGNIVEAEGLLRSVEERFQTAISRNALGVSAAGVYLRATDAYAHFLENCEFAGRKRTREAEDIRAKGAHVRNTFVQVLGSPSVVPLWVVDSLLPSLELPLEE